jgi:four helix bundle protein
MIKTYKDLIVWQKAMKLVKKIYQITAHFPKNEEYGLTIQMRKGSISIPSNIAEGYGRRRTGEYRHFLSISMGSLYELETQTEIGRMLEYIPQEEYDSLTLDIDEVERLLASLIEKLSAYRPEVKEPEVDYA